MRRILGLSACLCASAIVLLSASACSQSEGERCQVNSDCASGLVCWEGESGNGTCKRQNTNGGVTQDAAADGPLSSPPEGGPATDAATTPFVDVAPEQTPDAVISVDTTAVDGGDGID